MFISIVTTFEDKNLLCYLFIILSQAIHIFCIKTYDSAKGYIAIWGNLKNKRKMFWFTEWKDLYRFQKEVYL